MKIEAECSYLLNRNTLFRLIVCGALTLSGCTSIDDSISRVTLDSATCTKLLAQGIDCQNDQLLSGETLAHLEYHQQLLPIYQRKDIIEDELEALEEEH